MKRPHVIPANPYRARKRLRMTARVGRAARFGRYAKYFPRAAAVGAAGYGLYRAGRFIRRRIQSAKGSNITYRRWVFGSKTSFANLKRKTLASSTIRFTEPPNNNDDLRAAPGMRYKCSGFKMCATFRNVHAKPIHVHMAIVQPKEDNIFVSDIPVNMLSEAVSNTRYLDFIPFTADPTWDRNQDCSNLNPRKFNILTHQKFQLNRQGDGTFADIRTSGSNYVHFEKYFKLNKTFEYETPAAVEVVKPLWVLVWYETLFPENTDLTALEYNVNCIAHVKSVSA